MKNRAAHLLIFERGLTSQDSIYLRLSFSPTIPRDKAYQLKKPGAARATVLELGQGAGGSGGGGGGGLEGGLEGGMSRAHADGLVAFDSPFQAYTRGMPVYSCRSLAEEMQAVIKI